MVAQMERRFIKERQKEGIQRARAQGAYKGGKRRLDHQRVLQMHADGMSASNIAKLMACSRMHVYRILKVPRSDTSSSS
jgi:DNA invertase Pin-like site-specific DNA recombinase